MTNPNLGDFGEHGDFGEQFVQPELRNVSEVQAWNFRLIDAMGKDALAAQGKLSAGLGVYAPAAVQALERRQPAPLALQTTEAADGDVFSVRVQERLLPDPVQAVVRQVHELVDTRPNQPTRTLRPRDGQEVAIYQSHSLPLALRARYTQIPGNGEDFDMGIFPSA